MTKDNKAKERKPTRRTQVKELPKKGEATEQRGGEEDQGRVQGRRARAVGLIARASDWINTACGSGWQG